MTNGTYKSYQKLIKKNSLMHHGVEGQKWGQRRWQYEDGSLTPEGYEHYGVNPNYSRLTRKDIKRIKKTDKKDEKEIKRNLKETYEDYMHRDVTRMSDEELRRINTRLNLESQYYKNLHNSEAEAIKKKEKEKKDLAASVILNSAITAGVTIAGPLMARSLGDTDVSIGESIIKAVERGATAGINAYTNNKFSGAMSSADKAMDMMFDFAKSKSFERKSKKIRTGAEATGHINNLTDDLRFEMERQGIPTSRQSSLYDSIRKNINMDTGEVNEHRIYNDMAVTLGEQAAKDIMKNVIGYKNVIKKSNDYVKQAKTYASNFGK